MHSRRSNPHRSRPSLRDFILRRRRAAAPTPVRVRRMVDREAIVGAYGTGALVACPVEIVDLSDGTRVCEWDEPVVVSVARRPSILDGDPVLRELFEDAFGRDATRSRPAVVESRLRVRYASEEDMWRGLHARSAAKSDHRRTLRGAIGELAIAAWSRRAASVGAADSDLEIAVEPRAGFDSANAESARSAYAVRSSALAAVRLSWESADAELRVVHVELPGSCDDRQLDSLGRPNGQHRRSGPRRSSRPRRAAESRTL